MCVCGERPARMSGDQRDSGNLKTSVFLHHDPKYTYCYIYCYFVSHVNILSVLFVQINTKL